MASPKPLAKKSYRKRGPTRASAADINQLAAFADLTQDDETEAQAPTPTPRTSSKRRATSAPKGAKPAKVPAT